jgi:hypothetical protein
MSYQQWGPPPQENSSNATIALVLGICGFVVCPLICSVLAIVFASKAYTEIDNSGGRIGGRGMAQAGQILGWVGVGLCVLGILALIALIAFGVAVSNDLDNGDFDVIMPRFAR